MARTSAIAAMVLLALLLGCPPEEEPEPDPCEGVSAAMTLTDEHNYTFEGALDIESTPVAPLTDITFDFSGLQHDLLGHDLDPTSELDMASAIVFNLTEDEVEYGLSTGTLDQVHVTIFSSQETAGETELLLSNMFLFGNDFDIETYLEPDSGAWLLNLAEGTTPGVGTQMAAFFEPVDGETNTVVEVTDSSTILDFTVDLASMTKPAVPADDPALTVDWSGIETDGQGIEMADGLVDQVMVGRYDLTVEELEEQFLFIELIAEELYSADVTEGTSLDLTLLQDEDGNTFPGVDDQGTWLMALRCMTCVNPAPPALTILTACSD